MINKVNKYLFWLLLLVPKSTLAQGTPAPIPPAPPNAANPGSAPKLDDLIALVQAGGPLYDFMVTLGYSLSIAGIVYAGLIYFLPGSSEDKPARSKQAIIAVATGIAIIVMSKIIITIAGADELIT